MHPIKAYPRHANIIRSLRYVLVFLFTPFNLTIYSQPSGQDLIDSLKSELRLSLNDSIRATLIYEIANNCDMVDPTAGVRYARWAVALADTIDQPTTKAWALNALGINLVELGDYPAANNAYERSLQLFDELEMKEAYARVLVNRGTLLKTQSLYPDALECYQRAIDVFKSLEKQFEIAQIMVNIGNIYGGLGDHKSAISYFIKALDHIGPEGDPTARAILEGNLAISYHDLGKDSLAEVYFERSISAHRKLGNTGWEAMTLGNLASIRYDQHRFDESADLYDRALIIYRELGSQPYISWILIEYGLAELKRGRTSNSLQLCQEALNISASIANLENEMHACDCLAAAYEELNLFREALAMRNRYVALNDSIESQQQHDEVVRMVMQKAFAAQVKIDSLQREEEKLKRELQYNEDIHRKNNQRNLSIFIGFVVILLAGGLWGRLRYTRRSKKRIEAEKEVSENLLLNILPSETAKELKAHGAAQARLLENVTVLFTDFKGFTQLSEIVSPKELVDNLHECFSAFDHICEKYGIEKIKTIGDAYMAAGGVPMPTNDHAVKVVRAALEMRDFVEAGKARKIEAGLPYFEIRIGIHTGPVVAGIVGVKKFQYDIWGDTVNTASRMESSGKVGKVNISETTYKLVKDEFHFEYRGEIEAKGKGKMGMYFVSVNRE